MTEFVLSLADVKVVLDGLRLLQRTAVAAGEREKVDKALCNFRTQMTGKLKELEPFMRNELWVGKELAYERAEPFEERNCVCSTKDCGKACKGKRCADCWTEIMGLLHGTKGHKCKV